MVSRLFEPGREFFGKFLNSAGVESLCAVLREILDNTVVYGNRLDGTRKVSGTVQFLGEGEIDISIEDEGEGFENPEFSLSSLSGWRFTDPERSLRITMDTNTIESSRRGTRTSATVRFMTN
jgi:anti-sigma regulatory factor (Ser/Thr protein kinase)